MLPVRMLKFYYCFLANLNHIAILRQYFIIQNTIRRLKEAFDSERGKMCCGILYFLKAFSLTAIFLLECRLEMFY